MQSTSISWTDSSHNFWEGCTPVSAGCKYCYMFRQQHRFGKDGNVLRKISDKGFIKPVTWKTPHVIFTCSMSDFFHKDADQWREEAWNVIRSTPQHMWLILTKRPERINKCLPSDWGEGWKNVKFGISAENQDNLIRRSQFIIQVKSIHKHFISAEPLLDALELGPVLQVSMANQFFRPFDWVIVGGESGNDTGHWRYRPCDAKWVAKIVQQCNLYGVAVHVKQLGTHLGKQYKTDKREATDITDPKIPKEVRAKIQSKKEFPDNVILQK